MKVKLPGEYSGKEILDAFRNASAFEDRPGSKWEPHESGKEFQYESGPVRQTIRLVGLTVFQYTLSKKWSFCGKKVWSFYYSAQIFLDQLCPSGKYSEIDVSMQILNMVVEPGSPDFEKYRHIFERILEVFYRVLGNVPASRET
jgi:hypothetical protein